MIKVRCFRCHNAFQLTEQYLANTLAAQGKPAKPPHFVAECPRCRQAIKVPLRRVHLPEPEPAEEAPREDVVTE
jgi:hypothetical protein